MNNFMNPFYGQMNYQPMQNIPNPTQTDERIWVQNEVSAEAYLVAPNSFVRLWDSSKPRFYEKRADATGRPLPMDTFEYARIQPKSETLEPSPTVDYLKEINALKERISALESVKGGRRNATKSDADDSNV